MKKTVWFLVFALTLLAASPARAVVGYYNYVFRPGDNLFHNGLLGSDTHLSTLFPGAPAGTTVSLWDSAANAYGATSVYDSGSWSSDFTLPPGTGARLTTSALFTNTFVGQVLHPDGSLLGSGDSFRLPPPFGGPDGIYLLGCKTPLALSGNDVFLYVLGRAPNLGEQFTRLNSASQSYLTSTYLGGGVWDMLPSLAVGEAGFYNVGPIPEPSVLAFSLVGLAVFSIAFRRRR